MKKISFLALAFVTTLAVSAQQDPDKAHKPLRTDMAVQTRFGLRAGVNMAEYNADNKSASTPLSTAMKTSFHGGAFVNIPVGSVLRVQPEVDFSAQGSKIEEKYNAPVGTVRYEEDLYYINVPVMLQLQSRSGFFVETGPQAGFLIKAQTDGNGTYADQDIKDQRKGFDFSWGAGLGYLSRIGLGLNARYNHGISNIFNADNSTVSDRDYKNRVIQLGLVYHFGAAK